MATGESKKTRLACSPRPLLRSMQSAFNLPFSLLTYLSCLAFLYSSQEIAKDQLAKSRQGEQASEGRQNVGFVCTMDRQANTACHSYCGLGYIVLQSVQTMGIVLLVSPFVLGKHVFVLVSGCCRFGRQDKEGSKQMEHRDEHGGAVDISLMFVRDISF